jgi:hypothetical protein
MGTQVKKVHFILDNTDGTPGPKSTFNFRYITNGTQGPKSTLDITDGTLDTTSTFNFRYY